MNKVAKYAQLVAKRKTFQFSDGLLNPADIEDGIYDQDHLGPWSGWQGNLDAKILLIGQDWSDIEYFLTNKGRERNENSTNMNLQKLFRLLGIDIGFPGQPNHIAPTFFTNAILGIKVEGKMAGKVTQAWARESTKAFLVPLLEIIQPSSLSEKKKWDTDSSAMLSTSFHRLSGFTLIFPWKSVKSVLSVFYSALFRQAPRLIITLGAVAYREIAFIYGLSKHPLKKLIQDNPITLNDKKHLYAMYHCGPLGLANRKLNLQMQDWNQIVL